MSTLHPADRNRTGASLQDQLLGRDVGAPATLFEESCRDFIFAEVWTRPALDLRSRFIISISGAACTRDEGPLTDYVRGALKHGHLSLIELREAAVHLSLYAGWAYGGLIDRAATAVAAELGLPPANVPPLCNRPWDAEERLDLGRTLFKEIARVDAPPAINAYYEAGILNFAFAEVWSRPGLDQRGRRWISLVGVAESAAPLPMRAHIYGALSSGNATIEEINEFVLHYAVHGGWPKAAAMQMAAFEAHGLITAGKPLQ